MQRVLTNKESQIYEKFNSKVKLVPVTATILSLIKDNNNFIIQSPIIYQIEGTDSYLVFGDFISGYQLDKMKDHIEKFAETQLEDVSTNDNSKDDAGGSILGDNVKEQEQEHKQEHKIVEENVINNVQLREEDIKILMDQFNVTREEAIDALVKNNYDAVEAMMNLHDNK